MKNKILDKVNFPKDLKALSFDELNRLAQEVRHFLLEKVSKTGGHLASNLGVIELTIGLHYFLDCPRDTLIFDVGHQCYPHKILTGRKNKFKSLRMKDGLSGFPDPEESRFDVFRTGHASTSISTAMGIAEANRRKGSDKRVVAMIGDGAFTGGMALEGINQIGYLGTPMMIVLNDNRMSISQNVGALSEYTKRIEKTEIYQKVRHRIYRLMDYHKKIKSGYSEDVYFLKKALKEVGEPGLLFEKLGISYIGPVDGHSIEDVVEALYLAENKMKKYGPVLIHCRTIKGMGYEWAEKEAESFHGVGPFVIENGKSSSKAMGKTFTEVFGEKLLSLVKKNKKIIGITAAMASGTGLNKLANERPEQFIDAGICEQHAVGMAAGLAKKGFRPVVAIYSTFLQRAFDQVVHDVCLQNLPVIFAIDRAGLVGSDGPTHHGVFDAGFLRMLPNLSVMVPKDGYELEQMLMLAFSLKSPVAIRYPRGQVQNLSGEKRNTKSVLVKLGRAEKIAEGKNEAIVFAGALEEWARKKAQCKKSCAVWNVRFLKPLDQSMIGHLAKMKKVTVLEENTKAGGLGSAILEQLAKKKSKAEVKLIGLGDQFVPHGSVEELRREFLK